MNKYTSVLILYETKKKLRLYQIENDISTISETIDKLLEK